MKVTRGDVSNIIGTGLKGYLRCSKSKLIDVFGRKTHGPSPDRKVSERWILNIDGTIVHIYDYKSRYTRLPLAFNDFHVGGGKDAMNVLYRYLKEQNVECSMNKDEYNNDLLNVVE